jgi:cytochrome P450/nitrite reductase/ring-hydroxylating ferredoxin subunit
MTDAAWSRAALSQDLQGDGPHAVSVGDVDLVVLRTPSGLRAYEGRCPHQGALLGEGELEGGVLVCRNHRWRFDAATGQRLGGRDCLRACPVREENGAVLVDVGPLGAPLRPSLIPSRSIDDLPGPPPLPLIGNFHQLDIPRMHQQYETWAVKYGPVFVVRFGKLPIVAFAGRDVADQVLRARPDTYRRLSTVESVSEELGLTGVFAAEGAAWRPQRRLAMDALSHKNLRAFYPEIAKVARRLVARWERAADEGLELDIMDELKRFTVDVTMLLVFGHDSNTIEKDDADIIQRDLEHVFPAFARRLNSLFPYWRYLRLPGDRQLDRSIANIRAWFEGLARATRARLASRPADVEPANFIEAMLTSRDAEGRPFDEATVFGNALTMLLAGEDTTAVTLSWAVHQLLESPRSVATLRDELDRVLATSPVPGDVDAQGALAFAGAVASETMRLRPVAPLFFLENNEEVVLKSVRIPKGTGLVLLSRPPVMSDQAFYDPSSFRPERWLGREQHGGERAHDPSASIPFGSGPRICPGRSLALVEMRVVLAALYKNFDVERVGSADAVEERVSFVMLPIRLRVRLRRREAASHSTREPAVKRAPSPA